MGYRVRGQNLRPFLFPRNKRNRLLHLENFIAAAREIPAAKDSKSHDMSLPFA